MDDADYLPATAAAPARPRGANEFPKQALSDRRALGSADPPVPLPELASVSAAADRLAAAARAATTVRAYRSDFADFVAWCDGYGLASLPAAPDSVRLYLSHLAQRVTDAVSGMHAVRSSTIARRIAAIATVHRVAGYDPPTRDPLVREVWAGIRRTKHVAAQPKDALAIEELRAIIGRLGSRLIDRRDRALLLVGFAGAFRRAELVGLDLADLRWERQGVIVTLRSSKTNQDGQIERVAIRCGSDPQTCPIQALQGWLTDLDAAAGPIFRSIDRHGNIGARLPASAVRDVVRHAALRADLHPERLAAHSLRSGFVTMAARAGKSDRTIMRQTRHKSLAMVARYTQDASIWDNHAAEGIGL